MRDYASMTNPPPSNGARGVLIPRWLLTIVLFLVLSLLGWIAFAPPVWTIQRLDSPDGARTAVLSRTRFTKPAFVIKVKEGSMWRTLHISQPLPDDFRTDLGERIFWSSNSATLYFRMNDRVVWQKEFGVE